MDTDSPQFAHHAASNRVWYWPALTPTLSPKERETKVALNKRQKLRGGVLRWLCFALLFAFRAERVTAESDDEFLERLERAAFDYFWKEANPTNGLIRDRSKPDSKCSIAAVGFGLSAINIGVERGWISRPTGRVRVLTTLRTFAEGQQGEQPDGVIGHRGWSYHFLELNSGHRAWKCELSSIDTALLLAGVVDAREFYTGAEPDEVQIREFADQLVARVDWAWMTDGGDTFTMGWYPERGFLRSRWVGYNEAMLLYLLGLGASGGSTTNDSGTRASNSTSVQWEAWTRGYHWRTNYGYAYVEFAPLFGHQYSHCWVDFRGIADAFMRERGLTYFENSRRATLAQRAYCIANAGRFSNYGSLEWGITACDGPKGYAARGAPPSENDDGTLAPTAAGGSLPFAPEFCLPTLRHFEQRYGPKLWGPYGFRDAFNITENWWATDTLGIDQGPILLMIENHRTGNVWRRMMRSPIIQRGLNRAGFSLISAQPTTSRP
ncbi:MAG TPA: Tat pathway signal protein [Verrucomicrobiales bacterium]|nr:Tat pathway signal protein [Verrucomicrobiales bacterium]